MPGCSLCTQLTVPNMWKTLARIDELTRGLRSLFGWRHRAAAILIIAQASAAQLEYSTSSCASELAGSLKLRGMVQLPIEVNKRVEIRIIQAAVVIATKRSSILLSIGVAHRKVLPVRIASVKGPRTSCFANPLTIAEGSMPGYHLECRQGRSAHQAQQRRSQHHRCQDCASDPSPALIAQHAHSIAIAALFCRCSGILAPRGPTPWPAATSGLDWTS